MAASSPGFATEKLVVTAHVCSICKEAQMVRSRIYSTDLIL